MANHIMYREEAEKFLAEKGWKLFLDLVIKDKIIVMEKEIKTVFESYQYETVFGKIKIEEWPEGLVLWVGGEIRWKSWSDK